jgi:hypothetical protein
VTPRVRGTTAKPVVRPPSSGPRSHAARSRGAMRSRGATHRPGRRRPAAAQCRRPRKSRRPLRGTIVNCLPTPLSNEHRSTALDTHDRHHPALRVRRLRPHRRVRRRDPHEANGRHRPEDVADAVLSDLRTTTGDRVRRPRMTTESCGHDRRWPSSASSDEESRREPRPEFESGVSSLPRTRFTAKLPRRA